MLPSWLRAGGWLTHGPDTSDGTHSDDSSDLPPWPFDGPRPDLPDGPTEWHLSPSGFVSWDADKNDSTQYDYWIYAYPSASDDQSPATTRSNGIQSPPASAVSHETRRHGTWT